MSIRVVINGIRGQMGQEVAAAVSRDVGMLLVGGTSRQAAQLGNVLVLQPGEESTQLDRPRTIPLSADLDQLVASQMPDVVVDFSSAAVALRAARTTVRRGVHFVSGTTGLTQANLDEIDRLALAAGIGAVVASNFALGAVVMMHLAGIASRYLDSVEITEMHHHRKADAPSGTALSTARAIAESRGTPSAVLPDAGGHVVSRGEHVGDVTIHSIRIPGLLAHQEVLFGGEGQTLSVRHDTTGRECYIPGVLLAIREVSKFKGLVIGLAPLLSLG